MRIDSEYRFSASRDVVWDALQDPEILAAALPGTKRLDLVEQDRYEGEMQAGVGPVTAARFAVTVRLEDKRPPESFTMKVDGIGAAGFVRGQVELNLAEDGAETLMAYVAELQIGGRIAAVGQRLLDSVGRAMSARGLEAIDARISAGGAAGSEADGGPA